MKQEAKDAVELIERINNYLHSGGLFNPELANHDAVRDLLRDCRSCLELIPRNDNGE